MHNNQVIWEFVDVYVSWKIWKTNTLIRTKIIFKGTYLIEFSPPLSIDVKK